MSILCIIYVLYILHICNIYIRILYIIYIYTLTQSESGRCYRKNVINSNCLVVIMGGIYLNFPLAYLCVL